MIRKSLKSKPCPSKGKKRKRGRMPTKNRTAYGWKFPDGREICNLDTLEGRIEYKTRLLAMADRQAWKCGLGCGVRMVSPFGYFESMTFEHVNGRGAGKRDDRIEKNGKPYNLAACLKCNSEKGSRRSKLGRMGSGE